MTRKLLAGLFAALLLVPTVGCGDDKKSDGTLQNMAQGGHPQPVSQTTNKTGGNVPPRSN
jgi:hypothetical protein